MGCPLIVCGSSLAVQGLEVQDRLAEVDPGIGKSVGSDDDGKSRKAKSARGQVVLHHIYAYRSRHVGKKRAQFFPLLSPRGEGVVTLQQHPEIVLQTQVDRILKSKRDHFRLGGSLDDTAGVRALAQRGPNLYGGRWG